MKIMHVSSIKHPVVEDIIEEQRKKYEPFLVELVLAEQGKPHKITELNKNHIQIKNVKKICDQSYDEDLRKTFDDLLKKHQPDIIHIHSFSGVSLLPILNVASNLRIKKILTLHDYSLFCIAGVFHDGKKICNIKSLDKCYCNEYLKCANRNKQSNYPKLRAFWIDNIVNQSDKIICPSGVLKKSLVEVLGQKEKLTALYHPVSLPKSASKRKNSNKTVFGYLGSLSWIKGADIIEQAIKALPSDNFELLMGVLDFVGKEQINGLKKHKQVKIKKNLPRESLYKAFFSKIDYLIVPSIWNEIGPMTLLESLHFGVPVIINDIASLREKVTKENSLVFGGPKHLSRIMDSIIKGKKQVRFAGAAKQSSLKEYNRKLSSIYNQARLEEKGDLCFRLGCKCNSNCDYCVTGDNFPRDDIPYNQVIKALLEDRGKYDSVTFGGAGEPTINKNLFRILDFAYLLGYGLNMQTNGRLFCYPGFSKKMEKYNIHYVTTLNGPNAKIHDTITHSNGSFEQTIKGIKNRLRAGASITGKMVLTKKNYKHLDQTIKLMLDLGLKPLMVVFPTAFGTAFRRLEEVVPSYEEIKPYLNKALKKYRNRGVKLIVESVPYCILEPSLRELVSEVTFGEEKLYGLTLARTREEFNFIGWRAQQVTFFKQCKRCTHRSVCPGVYKNYVDKRGSGEFKPIRSGLERKQIQEWIRYHKGNKLRASNLRDAGNAPDLPEEVVVELTSRCNLNCDFCFNKNSFARKARKKVDLPAAKIKKITDNAAKLNIPYIRFTGGEPLLRKDIFELLKYAKSKNFKEVRLNTNGSLVDSKNVAKIAKHVDNVLVPLNSWNPAVDGKTTGMKEIFEKRQNALKLLKAAGISVVRSGTIATPDNIKHLEEIFRIVKKLKIDSWEVYRPVPTPKNKKQLSSKQVESLVKKLAKFKEQNWFVPIANAIPFCIYDKKKVSLVSLGAKFDDGHCRIVVDARGHAKPSYFIDENIGNPENIEKCWNNKLMKDLRQLDLVPKQCKECDYLTFCKGGSRFSAKLVNGSYDKKDPLSTCFQRNTK